MMRKKTAVLFLLMALLLNGCGVQQNSVSAVAPAAKEETMQIAPGRNGAAARANGAADSK